MVLHIAGWEFILILIYAIARIVFCLIRYEGDKFIFCFELLFSYIFLITSALFRALSPHLRAAFHYESFYDGVVIAFIFICTALITPIVTNNIRSNIDNGWQAENPPYGGIVNFVWLVILGLTCGGIFMVSSFDSVSSKLFITSGNLPVAFYQQLSTELNLLLVKTVDLLAALGAISGVCMTIIWKDGIWREINTNKKKEYYSTLSAAKAIAFAYFIIITTIALYIWFPIYKNFNMIKHFLVLPEPFPSAAPEKVRNNQIRMNQI